MKSRNKLYHLKRRVSVTVGIPAYNEALSCTQLVKDIFEQRQTSFTLKQVIVYSDGSTDGTIALLKKINQKKLRVVEGEKRLGIAAAQNAIVARATGDILVLLNADIALSGESLIERLVLPIMSSKADFTSGYIEESTPKTLLEKVIFHSMQWKHKVFEQYRSGDNLYTCHGPCRAFSKRYYKILRFPAGVAEDAYSYLYAKSQGIEYRYVKTAKVQYKLPKNLSDHASQSLRFNSAKKHLLSHFTKSYLNDEFRLPAKLILVSLMKSFFQDPMKTIAYLILIFSIKVKSYTYEHSELFHIAVSSKGVFI